MYYMLCPVITCMITCHYMLPFCITCSITWYLDSYYTIFCLQLHVFAIYYMPYHVTSLQVVAAAAEAVRHSRARDQRARNQRARDKQSFFCWIHFVREKSSARRSLWSPCCNVVAASMRSCHSWNWGVLSLCWWCLGMSWMWLQNIQAILPSSKIESARSKFNTELIGKWMIHIK